MTKQVSTADNVLGRLIDDRHRAHTDREFADTPLVAYLDGLLADLGFLRHAMAESEKRIDKRYRERQESAVNFSRQMRGDYTA